jgi:hypothetical protein
MFAMLIVCGALLTAAQEPAENPAGTSSDPGTPAALAEYNALKQKTPRTADAHWKLGLWCERHGLKAEAELEFLAVIRLDPRRDSAWKKLGMEKSNGRWVRPEEAAAERREADAQRKADAKWRPLLQRWKGWLAQKEKTRRAEAETALAAVDDPRAVPSIWKVFATGGPADQERAIDVLGRIDDERASRALAGLAIFGKTELVRRAAVETLLRRKPDDVLMTWIGLLRDPIKYEVRQVAGPGSPGVMLVQGARFNVRRWYAPPSVQQVEQLFVDSQLFTPPKTLAPQFNSHYNGPPAGARQVGEINGVNMYIFDYTWAPKAPPPKKTPDPTGPYQAFEKMQLQAQLDRDFEFAEAAKMALGAQARLQNDVAAVEGANAVTRERNARLIDALRRVSGKDFGTDREAWLKWWMERKGYNYVPPRESAKATVDVNVPLPYVPASGPLSLTSGGGGGGGSGFNWCMVWEHDKGQRPRTGTCFAAGTLVQTPAGPRPIERLRAGDVVLTADGDRLSLAAAEAPIVAVHASHAARTLRLVVGGEAVVTTEGHPFWKVGAGWTRAGDLRPADLVRTRFGPARVNAVELQGAAPVWNLTVAGGSSYFVATGAVLVHDASPPWTGP